MAVLTQPDDYRKSANRMLPLIRRKYRAYPKLVEALANRHLMYNEELDYIAKEESDGRLFVIRPETALPIRRVEKDPEKLRLAYQAGRDAASSRMEALLAFLT